MRSVTVHWADEHIALVEKPAGMLVHRSTEAPDRDVLLQRVAAHFGAHVHAVNRIDRAASGIVVFALHPDAARWAQAALAAPEARKEYLLLARGNPLANYPSGRWEVDRPLTDPNGVKKPSRSAFEVVQTFAEATLVRARIFTGRRHQLRRHLNHCGHHIVGDTTHGKGHVNRKFRELYGLPRMFLHGCRLELQHPDHPEPLAIDSPLPDDLSSTLDRIKSA